MSVLSLFASFQQAVMVLLSLAAFIIELVAFIDSLRFKDEVYRAAGKWNKTGWCIILGIALALGFTALPPMSRGGFGMLTILGFVAAAVYMLDVRRALRAVDPRYRNRR
ncbi:DUF2516 family protein [Brevibacterium sp. 50QC2O2]|jgi:hypothetical protein|uniref:DUF2516 family protein n=1 Tax=Brevibacterium TaxID=1696 RepID=UPI00211C22DF|nr:MULTISPECIES: DUF2516 family protein [unclassified Brevibacterium]MCQ9368931.1 DUF2516 family protein [Brevibacterium sp. 91QC2O2]MCQ9385994.1 DUF2516 family protein [Brevibacterium sp. 68QC2CO]MCQ9387715.1 DUF2516 family protein [Brevibacterium sp. 50QC2O2]